MTQAPPKHAADRVFDAIARSILDGTILPGTPIPAERLLAEEHQTSRIIVRQAMHRLADYGLVQTNQGSATIARDPQLADLPLVELALRLQDPDSESGKALRRDLREHHALARAALLDAAHRKASASERANLLALVTSLPLLPTREQINTLEAQLWERVADMAQNTVFDMQARWWKRLPLEHSEDTSDSPAELRWFYRQLAKRLAKRQDPVPHYLAHVRAKLSAR